MRDCLFEWWHSGWDDFQVGDRRDRLVRQRENACCDCPFFKSHLYDRTPIALLDAHRGMPGGHAALLWYGRCVPYLQRCAAHGSRPGQFDARLLLEHSFHDVDALCDFFFTRVLFLFSGPPGSPAAIFSAHGATTTLRCRQRVACNARLDRIDSSLRSSMSWLQPMPRLPYRRFTVGNFCGV